MSSALIAPELEMFPDRYRWTVKACSRLAKLGFLEGRFEVVDGEIVSKIGQKPSHRIVIILIMNWLLAQFDALNIQTEAPIALSGTDGIYTEPEPDVAITREPTTAYTNRHPGPDDLLLIIEVSDSSIRADLLVKAPLYARAGIAEYWTLDLNARQLHIHRSPDSGQYAIVTVHSEDETVALAVRPNAPVSVAALLPPVTV